MAYQVPLATIMTRVRQRANLEGTGGATGFLPDAELQDMVNSSISEWYDLVRLSTWGGQYYRKAVTFSTATQQQTYNLEALGASDLLSVLSVDCFITGNQVISAHPYQEEMRNAFRFWPVGWLFGSKLYYQMQGPNIAFIPTPQGVFQVTVNYVPTAPQLLTGLSLDAINGWDEWIVLDCAIKALVKDGQTDIIPALEGMRAKQEQRIMAAAQSRDGGPAECVHDYDTDWEGGESI